MTVKADRQHEVAFCSEVSKWSDQLFQSDSSLPFGSSDIESFGRGSQKRQDFRVYERATKGRGKLALCGEVKLPGTQQGRSPFDPALMKDAYEKATNANCQYFFTWNVEHLALFDRALWDADTMHERCVGQWELGLELNQPADVMRAEVIARLRDQFLPTFYKAFSDIWTGQVRDISLPPSDFYITVLESHLGGPMGPVRELRDYLGLQSEQSAVFDFRLREWMTREQQWNFDRSDPESWRRVIDRAARSMVYVLSNRILFYQAVRLRNDLPELEFPRRAKKDPKRALEYLHECFKDAVEKTLDYEPVFFPEGEKEWAALMALSGTNSLDAWDKTIRAIDRFNFKEIPTDILGHVFQKLISPEERHKFGQHYTDEDIVDLINAFCIRKGDAAILDPACGSGSFLVRAYYRKWELDKRQTNQELLEGIYGCDINPFPAHLATLNLAARNIANEENYPRIARRNFFTVGPGKPFCEVPVAMGAYEGRTGRANIKLPELEAVVGNPPYVRHEDIPKESQLKRSLRDQSKEHIYETAEKPWPDLNLSKQSDLHVYFWPVAAQFLKEDGWFGFLTSSSWLDARYGFALQRWILQNFRLVAVIESVDEPWFEDARVKTAATILQRCDDATKRDDNQVKFVQLRRPLAEILGKREDESQKQKAAEKLRDHILKKKSDFSSDQLRIMTKRQADLWDEGLSVAAMFKKQKELAQDSLEGVDDEDPSDTASQTATQVKSEELFSLDYGGGKWGRYLRAPDLYFDMMREFGDRFTRMGEITTFVRGITSGCDAFFMPRNVSAQLLSENESEQEWKALPLMRRCNREQVVSGEVVIVQCGDKTLHPVEAKYVRPEVHSLMQVDRPLVSEKQLDRVVLWVNEPLAELKGTYVHHFIIWGSKQTFASNKSKAVPVPNRATCAGRDPWYDLTGSRPGIGLWPKSQQYRHIIPANPSALHTNCNLYDIHALEITSAETRALMPVLNSTVVAFVKPFYGRYAGTEGNLKTEVVDSLMLEIPDPRNVTSPVLKRLEAAFVSMQTRKVTHLVEEAFLECHTADEVREAAKLPLGLPLELQQEDRRELDDAVFEMLGVSNAARRQELIDHLYREVALHHRSIRIVEVQKMEQRRHGSGAKISVTNLATSAWNELEPEWQKPLSEWIGEQVRAGKTIRIPEGEVRLPEATNFFEANTVYFGKKPAVSLVCDSRAEAELVSAIARAGLHIELVIPNSETACLKLSHQLESRMNEGFAKLEDLAQQYAGTDKVRDQVAAILKQWFIARKS